MNDLEQKLKNARLSAPSPELDRRIDDAFAAARRRENVSRKTAIWWWIGPVTAAGCAAAALAISARRSPPSEQVAIYRIEAQGLMREMLLDRTTTHGIEPNFVFRVNPQ